MTRFSVQFWAHFSGGFYHAWMGFLCARQFPPTVEKHRAVQDVVLLLTGNPLTGGLNLRQNK